MRKVAGRGTDAGMSLVRSLRLQADDSAVAIVVRSIASRPWASATFSGTQHQVAIEVPPGVSSDRWIAGLPDAEWAVRGHLVADVVIDRVAISAHDRAVSISILTIEDN